MSISIRKFKSKDIQLKVKWINDTRNNQFLHYNIPINESDTKKWFDNLQSETRFDGIIEFNKTPVGLIGLLNIDKNQQRAEFYITLGEHEVKGKGIAKEATYQLMHYAFHKLFLKEIYITTEIQNESMIKLAETIGMNRIKKIKSHSYRSGRFHDVYYYTLTPFQLKLNEETPVHFFEMDQFDNKIYIKREDQIDFSFGGNKARKMMHFENEIRLNHHDYVVTYGSVYSNHCRVIANMAKKLGIKCLIITPNVDSSLSSINQKLIELSEAKVVQASLHKINDTINAALKELIRQNNHPYFIPGGGHNDLGTHAYAVAYNEILTWEKNNNINFDYIFFATGTGTTHAGLIIGQLLSNNSKSIIGISIAREKDHGSKIVKESIEAYLNHYKYPNFNIKSHLIFTDYLVPVKYGETNEEIDMIMKELYTEKGIAFNKIYSGKAYVGMKNFIRLECISNKKILFIHTGGIPLFFDDLIS